MRKLAILALLTILGGAWYVVRDPGHVPLFDAGLQRLAETEAEGYCTGAVFADNEPQERAAKICRTETTKSVTFDLLVVQQATCQGYDDEHDQAGSQWIADCTAWMQAEQWWPTFDGMLTQNWSDSAPYPLDQMLVSAPSDSRTGQRDGFSRDDKTTTSTTTEETTTTEAAE